MLMNKTLPLLATCGLAVGGAFAISAPQAFAEFTSSAQVTANQVHAGTVQVQLVDGAGAVLSTPIVNLTNAQPSMTTKTYTIRIKNKGSLPAAIELSSAGLVDATAQSLDDVLHAVVKTAGGATVFDGKVSALSVPLASVAAGQLVELTLELTWPDVASVDDNPYQDGGLTFTLAVAASQLIA